MFWGSSGYGCDEEQDNQKHQVTSNTRLDHTEIQRKSVSFLCTWKHCGLIDMQKLSNE